MAAVGKSSIRYSGTGLALRAFALALLTTAVWAVPASAGDWTAFSLRDDRVGGGLYSISCPSTSLCVAGGSDTLIATSVNPAVGGAAWTTFHPAGKVKLEMEPNASGESTFPGSAIRGIACPSTTLCVGVTFDGRVLSSTDPTGGESTWKVMPLGGEKEPHIHMTGVACPSPQLCVAVAYGSKVITSTDPTGDASAWVVGQLASPVDLRGISCPSVSFCVAVDNAGQVLTSSNPIGGAGTWGLAGAPGGAGSLNAISCPSLTLCVTGNAGQMITSTDPGGGLAAWNAAAAGTGLPVKGVSCPTTSACAAVDNNADAIVSTNPLGGSVAWSSTNVIPAPFTGENPLGAQNGIFGISCPSTTLCIGVGASENVIASTNPFAPDVTPTSRRKSTRPRVVITRHPAVRVSPHRHGVRVGFRFHAVGGHPARLRCRLLGAAGARVRWKNLRRFHFTRCTSPIHYRLGKGLYKFSVQAISAGGRKGPPARFGFRVGHLTEREPVGSCRSFPGEIEARPCVNAR
jgi:hypothetical protein